MHVRWGGREFTEPHGEWSCGKNKTDVLGMLSEQGVQWTDSGLCTLVKFFLCQFCAYSSHCSALHILYFHTRA